MEEFDESIVTRQSFTLANSTSVTPDDIIKTNRVLRLIKGRCFFIFSKRNHAYKNIDKTSAEKVYDYSIAEVLLFIKNVRESHYMQSNFLWKFLSGIDTGKEIAHRSIGRPNQMALSKNVKDVVETALSFDKFCKKENKSYTNYTQSCSSWANLTHMSKLIQDTLEAEMEVQTINPEEIIRIKSANQKELNRLQILKTTVQRLMSGFQINYMEDEEMREILKRTAYVDRICRESG